MAKDRPFSPEIIHRTNELVPLYQVLVRWDKDEDCYVGECVELPNAIGGADTEADCVAEVRGNIRAQVMYMLECGERPPLAEEPERGMQVNVRYADYEKATAERLAKAAGRTLSEHIRLSSLRAG